jgi:hypothetical protein
MTAYCTYSEAPEPKVVLLRSCPASSLELVVLIVLAVVLAVLALPDVTLDRASRYTRLDC